MSKEAAKRIPDTISAQESMHNYYYMVSGKNHNIITGEYYLILYYVDYFLLF
jgi:hypothetical protein